MRICHLISGDLWAGAEVMACQLLKSLHSHPDIDLSVIVLNEGRLTAELWPAGVMVHVVDETSRSFLQLACAIGKILVSTQPELIHSHRYKENLLAFSASRWLSNVRLVCTQHGLPERYGRKESLNGRIKSGANSWVLSRFFHRVVAVSEDIRTHFIKERLMSADRVSVIRNGIEIPAVVHQRDSFGKDFLVGSSGRLFPVKDYPLLVSIAQELAEEEGIFFSLAGEGPERTALERAVADGRLEGMFLLKGHVEGMDPFYRELDVYVNTSIHEGIPMTILEAMARGLPVIAAKVGGIPEVVTDGVEGFLIEGRNPKEFADKILLLRRDSDLRRRMGERARKRAEKDFSVQGMSDGYMRLYREVSMDTPSKRRTSGSN